MTGQTLNGAAERQQYLLNEVAALVVSAGDAAAAHGKSSWLDTLEKLAEVAGAAQHNGLAADAAALKAKLLSLEGRIAGLLRRSRSRDGKTGGIDPCPCRFIEDRRAGEVPAASNIAEDPELIADFIVESREHLRAIEQNVLAVEQDRSQMDPIHAMFRAFHTIKGIAGFLEFQSIRDVSHETETLLDMARNGKLVLTPAVIDVILESADYLSREVTRIEVGFQRTVPAGG